MDERTTKAIEALNSTPADEAMKVMLAAEGIWQLEEHAMYYLWSFAERLEKTYHEKLESAGIERVDYFALAARFTLSMLKFESQAEAAEACSEASQPKAA